MKITTNDAIYIQKTDLLYLQQLKYPMGKSIKTKVYQFIVIGEEHESDFVKFTNPDEIEFFSSMDWLLEYDSVINMTLDDINNISEEVYKEQMSLNDDQRNTKRIDRFDQLNLKIKSLRDALLFKQGSLKITLPKELRIFFPEKKKSFIRRVLEKIS